MPKAKKVITVLYEFKVILLPRGGFRQDGALPPCGGFRKNGALLPRGGFRTNLRFSPRGEL